MEGISFDVLGGFPDDADIPEASSDDLGWWRDKTEHPPQSVRFLRAARVAGTDDNGRAKILAAEARFLPRTDAAPAPPTDNPFEMHFNRLALSSRWRLGGLASALDDTIVANGDVIGSRTLRLDTGLGGTDGSRHHLVAYREGVFARRRRQLDSSSYSYDSQTAGLELEDWRAIRGMLGGLRSLVSRGAASEQMIQAALDETTRQ